MRELTVAPTPKPRLRPTIVLLTINVCLLAVVALIGVRAWRDYPLFGPYQLHGFAMAPTEPVDFTLTGPDGVPTRLSDFRGQWVLLTYGYTESPNFVPATLDRLAAAVRELADSDQAAFQILLVSVDPTDTPARMAAYTAPYDVAVTGLTGTAAAVEAAKAPLGIYATEPATVNGTRFIQHTTTTALLDRDGVLRVVYTVETPAAAIAADLRHLLRTEG